MTTEAEAMGETYGDLDRVIRDLVERYAIPHTKMCMRWSKPTKEAYRQEVASWLEDYGKYFARLPRKAFPGKEDFPTFARVRLAAEIAPILRGENGKVERSYANLFE